MEGNYQNLFNYKIDYSKKRKRTVAFKVEDGILHVISPIKVSISFLMGLIEKRKFWTLERLNKKKKRPLIENNRILFLGNEIELNINENKLLKDGGYCDFNNNQLTVNISQNWNKSILEEIIKSWYINECLNLITQRVKFYAETYNFHYGKIAIREQKTVWGTCNCQNNLSFNWKIITFNQNVIDYLVVHELVHTIHKNHSREYWQTVEKIIPDYRELNRQLK